MFLKYVFTLCLFTALALKHSDVCYEIYLSVTYVQNINQQHYLTVVCVQQIDALMSTVTFALCTSGSAGAPLGLSSKNKHIQDLINRMSVLECFRPREKKILIIKANEMHFFSTLFGRSGQVRSMLT